MTKKRTVNVYDRSNHKRLLGTLDVSQMGALQAPRLKMAAATKVSASYYSLGDRIPSPLDVVHNVAEFDLAGWEPKPGSNGWERQAYATTDAPLEVLMGIRHFLLPGEDLHQAERRRYYA